MMSASISLGNLTIQDETQKALNQAGANTGGYFTKANVTFLGNLTLNDKFSLKGSVKRQKVLTGNNLDPIEQLFISGTAGVKSYHRNVQRR